MDMGFVVDGREHSVKIEWLGKGDEFRAVVDGQVCDFGMARISENRFSIMLGTRTVSATVCRHQNRYYVHLDGTVFELTLPGTAKKNYSADGVEFASGEEITTPMPGKIVKTLVKEGDRVSAKQPLVIVESMKMENEIRSPRDALVRAVCFKPGDLVQPGEAIVKLEPLTKGEA